MATINVFNGPTIAQGQSLSGVVDASGTTQGVKRILMPPGWTPAWLSFQISPDGVTFADLYWGDGRLVVVTVVPGSTIVTNSSLWHSAYFKFRSGTALSPVPQAQARAFKCVLHSGV